MKAPALEQPGPGTGGQRRDTQGNDTAIAKQRDDPSHEGSPHSSVTETEQIHNLSVLVGMRKNNVAPEFSIVPRGQDLVMHKRVPQVPPIQILGRTFDTGTITRAHRVRQMCELLLATPLVIYDRPSTVRKGREIHPLKQFIEWGGQQTGERRRPHEVADLAVCTQWFCPAHQLTSGGNLHAAVNRHHAFARKVIGKQGGGADLLKT